MPSIPPQKIDYPKYTDSLWFMYVVSTFSAWNAELVTYPLDLIKTRLQIQGEKSDLNSKGHHRGFGKTSLGIIKEEGFFQLWNGVHAVMIRHVFYSGSRIVIYKAIKEKVFKSDGTQYFPLWQSAVCGVSAGGIGQYIASPADLLKVQLQMEGKRKLMGLPPRVNGLYDAFIKVWNAGGVRGLWKGAIPNVQRAALVTLGDITTYDVSKRFILKHSNLEDNYIVHFLGSVCAGFSAAVLATPADVVKTRVMNQPVDELGRGLLYRSSLDCFRTTVRQEGYPALFKGFLPIWMRLAPWAITFWLSYEKVMFLVSSKPF